MSIIDSKTTNKFTSAFSLVGSYLNVSLAADGCLTHMSLPLVAIIIQSCKHDSKQGAASNQAAPYFSAITAYLCIAVHPAATCFVIATRPGCTILLPLLSNTAYMCIAVHATATCFVIAV